MSEVTRCNAQLYLCINGVLNFPLKVLDKLVFFFDPPTFSKFWQEEGHIAVSLALSNAHRSPTYRSPLYSRHQLDFRDPTSAIFVVAFVSRLANRPRGRPERI